MAKPKKKPQAKRAQPAKQTAAKQTKPKQAKPAKPKQRATKPAAAPMFQKIAFTMFWVEDPTRARAFYEQTLGFTRGSSSASGVWTEYDLPGGGCLALFHHPDPNVRRPTPGGASVAFEVADLDALNEQLQAAGVVYDGDVIHSPVCRMSNIRDSEGNAIMLHELK